MKRNTSVMRVIPELRDLIEQRANNFGTRSTSKNWSSEEQKNIMTIISDLETTLKIDIKSISVTNNKKVIFPDRKMIWLK